MIHYEQGCLEIHGVILVGALHDQLRRPVRQNLLLVGPAWRRVLERGPFVGFRLQPGDSQPAEDKPNVHQYEAQCKNENCRTIQPRHQD